MSHVFAGHQFLLTILDLENDLQVVGNTTVLPTDQLFKFNTSTVCISDIKYKHHESITCVAQITGFPILLHRPIIIFCAKNTFSGGISMPKSPLATMIPSASLTVE